MNELVVTIVLCGWCHSARPIRVDGAEGVPPGLHNAKLQISHSMCTTCEVKWRNDERKGGVTHSDTPVRDNATEETG